MRLTRTTNRMSVAEATHGCRLRVIHGADAGLEIEIPGAGVVVGAEPAADVVLQDAAVSRRHCTIVPRAEGFDVTDLGSRNGTLVDGVAIQKATVPVGAVLRVGSSLLELVPAEECVLIPPSERGSFGALVGSSVAMRQIYAVLERASASNAPILLLGESGTGKELAARAVHDHSPRKDQAFVVFDCGASSETLIESDLFGHVKGAFTGAHADRPGAFELAHGGTLFLDEIGDLPLALQPKLLRLLETGEVTRLGGRRPERFDVRVVAATHRNLEEEVSRGTFRGDLFYRLAVVEVHLPPLRQRLEDVEELVRVFLAREGRPEQDLASENLNRLLRYNFPGNVRELRNIIARAVALSPPGAPFAELPILLSGATSKRDTDVVARADRPFQEAKSELILRFERDYLKDLLLRAGDNVSQAARISGIERKHLYRLLERAGMSRKDS
ncbi:MAG: sigma 54-interacting transcriptional regulator [Myxococcales bacterium]|nr:sigma 54-interacting transcriptional regulator [Myxococcales bacterium]MCB9581229.1 sigma 54-interacting transcriptional regulator [Polyangiaceae bacterium]